MRMLIGTSRWFRRGAVARRARWMAPGRARGFAALVSCSLACSAGSDSGPEGGGFTVTPESPEDQGLCAEQGCSSDAADLPDNVVVPEGEGTVSFNPNLTAAGGGIGPSDKVDLLFVVDNSISMADKQEVFSQAIPDLLERLVNPPCLTPDLQQSQQPASAQERCPDGMARQFAPVQDIHVGIVTSSMGPLGADDPPEACRRNDAGHLVGALPRGASTPTYQDLGFLAWDPGQRVDAEGHSDIGEMTGAFLGLLGSVSEQGCGFEAPLEAMYRFLMDPAPPAEQVRVPCSSGDQGNNCLQRRGLDENLLAQRRAFLRPDSVVAIIMLADEDDCSVRDTDIGWYNLDQSRGITRASAACESDPNDACCRSCSFAVPAGCPSNEEDAACSTSPIMAREEEQSVYGQNLRCIDQRRKYGFDYLFPVERYVLGLTSAWLPEGYNELGEPLRDEAGEIRFAPNPLYSEPVGMQMAVRDPSSVYFVGIVGVPWQDVATAETVGVEGQLDLIAAKEFEETQFWQRVLGDPRAGVEPLDPFAIESREPRAGTHPVTGDPIISPDQDGINGINGRERLVVDDLQYACIFELPESRDCASVPDAAACDCRQSYDRITGADENPFLGDPLCWNEQTAGYSTVQFYAKAYPAPRILSVLKGIGEQAVVASICPKNMTNPAARDFGYRPVIGTFIQEAARSLIQ